MIRRKILLGISLFSCPLFSMVCDNQFMPLFPRIFTRHCDLPSRCAVDAFFVTGDSAFDENENHVPIPDLYGKYDENKLANALVKVGEPNYLPSEFRGNKIPWSIHQKIEGQAVCLSFEYHPFAPIYIGFSSFLMHMVSRQTFELQKKEVGTGASQAGYFIELEDARLKMHKALGLAQAQSARTGMSDFDLYLRVGDIWDYSFKCRAIDAGVTLGVVMPSGLTTELCNAAAIPFGGNGHWGMYFAGDADFELKEDMFFGFTMRLQKRFAKTYEMRLPVAGEHPLFGALKTQVNVEPGVSFNFAPYFALENIREGFGARVGINVTAHQDDYICDQRSRAEKADLPSETKALKKVSDWGADYIVLNAYYDFGKMDVERSSKPIVTFGWDIPYMLLVSKNNCKTHRITLGIEVNF